MNYSEIKNLINIVNDSKITEFEININGAYMRASKAGSFAPYSSSQALGHINNISQNLPNQYESIKEINNIPIIEAKNTALEQNLKSESEDASKGHLILSPIVATYYESQSDGKPPFVQIGQSVKKGDILCILEAMKVMNEITSDKDGIISEIFIKNGAMVEARQPLFKIE